MSKVGIGIYAKKDMGWPSFFKDIFKVSGIEISNYVIVPVEFVAHVKTVKTLKNNDVEIDRLRYQNKFVYKGELSDLNNLLVKSTELHIAWVGHGGSGSINKIKGSMKFEPHYDPKKPNIDAPSLSAKELARTIRNICTKDDSSCIYPNSLTVFSCNAGLGRHVRALQEVKLQGEKKKGTITLSKSDEALAFRVLFHLKGMYQPAPRHTCVVAAPTRNLQGSEIRQVKIPPTGDPWVQSQL